MLLLKFISRNSLFFLLRMNALSLSQKFCFFTNNSQHTWTKRQTETSKKKIYKDSHAYNLCCMAVLHVYIKIRLALATRLLYTKHMKFNSCLCLRTVIVIFHTPQTAKAFLMFFFSCVVLVVLLYTTFVVGVFAIPFSLIHIRAPNKTSKRWTLNTTHTLARTLTPTRFFSLFLLSSLFFFFIYFSLSMYMFSLYFVCSFDC